MIESNKTYEDSYKTIENLLRQNSTSGITIDYNKLDNNTSGALRKAISGVLFERKREVGAIITYGGGIQR